MFNVEFYHLPNGDCPVREFLDGLDPRMRDKATTSLEILEEFGNQLREPRSKALGDGLFELRIRFSNDIAQVFYFFFVGHRIIVTNGFIKKTQKTPASELKLARKYKADFERRQKDE